MTEPQYGPPQGQPIQFSPVPEVPRKRKRWPWVLGSFFVLIVVMFGGCVYYGLQIFNSPTGAGTVFAAAIEQGQHEVAYDSLCAESKSEISFEEFVEDYVPSQDVTAVEPVTVSLNPSDDTDLFVVIYVLADDSREVVEYPMVNDGDSWMVCDPPMVP